MVPGVPVRLDSSIRWRVRPGAVSGVSGDSGPWCRGSARLMLWLAYPVKVVAAVFRAVPVRWWPLISLGAVGVGAVGAVCGW